ncbi:MAG: undecaprenyl/decaprenyl-phosphate alpha-N-acetylglucosaminyl 1-phosphate transferase [Verrucomicrobiales bacterium]|nr:undecaprenyl/decaprenyl-phosphate alpha-N-acetylglucosaminyl 1-phosphate transferase [Verrucomicrobiales bacterium]
MSFPLNLYLASLVGAFLASLLALPVWRSWCLRHGHVDDPGARKIHGEPMPLAGGLAVMTGVVVPLLAGALVLGAASMGWVPPGWAAGDLDRLDYGFGARRFQLVAILVGLLGMMFLGWWDDRHELRPLPKFAGQFLIALLVAAAGVRVTLFIPSLAASYVLTVLWIVGVTNALNFLDNMNGLCAGIGAIGAGFFALAAARHGQYLVAAVALLGCGALLGFLPWNYPRATSFLGDAGSHACGFLLAVLAILPSFHSPEHPHPVAVLSPLLVLVVPLADLASVVWIRWRLGRPPWIGDTNHFSHRLVRAGWSRPAAVAWLWAAALAGGVVALAL